MHPLHQYITKSIRCTLYMFALLYAHPSALQCFKQTVLLNDKGTAAQPVECDLSGNVFLTHEPNNIHHLTETGDWVE